MYCIVDNLCLNQDLYKKVRGILNKLTPQKFETLLKQVQDLPINSEERLSGCIEIIFEKVIITCSLLLFKVILICYYVLSCYLLL